jgi:hypothetical protein
VAGRALVSDHLAEAVRVTLRQRKHHAFEHILGFNAHRGRVKLHEASPSVVSLTPILQYGSVLDKSVPISVLNLKVESVFDLRLLLILRSVK